MLHTITSITGLFPQQTYKPIKLALVGTVHVTSSVDKSGNILAGSFGKQKGGPKFIRDNIKKIARGIRKWWYYNG